MGHSKGSPEREVHSDTGLSKKKKTRKISNKQPNPMPTRTRVTTKIAQRNQKEGKNQGQIRVK